MRAVTAHTTWQSHELFDVKGFVQARWIHVMIRQTVIHRLKAARVDIAEVRNLYRCWL